MKPSLFIHISTPKLKFQYKLFDTNGIKMRNILTLPFNCYTQMALGFCILYIITLHNHNLEKTWFILKKNKVVIIFFNLKQYYFKFIQNLSKFMSQTRFNNFIYSELEQDYESKKVCAASTLGLVSFSRIYIYIYILYHRLYPLIVVFFFNFCIYYFSKYFSCNQFNEKIEKDFGLLDKWVTWWNSFFQYSFSFDNQRSCKN